VALENKIQKSAGALTPAACVVWRGGIALYTHNMGAACVPNNCCVVAGGFISVIASTTPQITRGTACFEMNKRAYFRIIERTLGTQGLSARARYKAIRSFGAELIILCAVCQNCIDARSKKWILFETKPFDFLHSFTKDFAYWRTENEERLTARQYET
jgi:hypothetical protein